MGDKILVGKVMASMIGCHWRKEQGCFCQSSVRALTTLVKLCKPLSSHDPRRCFFSIQSILPAMEELTTPLPNHAPRIQTGQQLDRSPADDMMLVICSDYVQMRRRLLSDESSFALRPTPTLR